MQGGDVLGGDPSLRAMFLVLLVFVAFFLLPKGLDCFWALKTGCFKGPLRASRGRGSPLEGPGVCIGGVMTLRALFFWFCSPFFFFCGLVDGFHFIQELHF